MPGAIQPRKPMHPSSRTRLRSDRLRESTAFEFHCSAIDIPQRRARAPLPL